jgi:hypothetical protein
MSTQQRNMVGIPPLLSGIFIGLLLSDGCLQIQRGGRNARFEFSQGTINSSFALYVLNLFNHYCHPSDLI